MLADVIHGPAPTENLLKINLSQRKIEAQLQVVTFEDHGHHIAFIPSLNLSYYGSSPEEAKKDLFSVVVDDYFDHLTELNERDVYRELKKFGWEPKPFFKKQLKNRAYVDREGILRNFNLPEETEIKEQFVAV